MNAEQTDSRDAFGSPDGRCSAHGDFEIMVWDTDLYGVARDIAATVDSPLQVMASPGTGKSFALKRRVARLLEEGANPIRILAVTLTRNAAASLVDDLQNLGVPGCDRIRSS